ncbi:ferritin family protein [Peptococcus simiae]|uniref:Ferritin family protein n=1 Tax=Peptococcus simiae TaxID=1643805 RepID=A0ABW9GXS0_9FIRM
MSNELVQVLCRGLLDELESADAFVCMAQEISRLDLKLQFIQYAQEELSHASYLSALLGRLAPDLVCASPSEPPDFSEGLMAFMVTYLAKEEAAVFYYETLLNMVEKDDDRAILKRIYEEEKGHYEDLTEIIKAHAVDIMEAGYA